MGPWWFGSSMAERNTSYLLTAGNLIKAKQHTHNRMKQPAISLEGVFVSVDSLYMSERIVNKENVYTPI